MKDASTWRSRLAWLAIGLATKPPRHDSTRWSPSTIWMESHRASSAQAVAAAKDAPMLFRVAVDGTACDKIAGRQPRKALRRVAQRRSNFRVEPMLSMLKLFQVATEFRAAIGGNGLLHAQILVECRPHEIGWG